MTKKLTRLGNPFFLVSLGVLILNDWVLKAVFHNYVTGKLSDFAGLFAFPFFGSVLFPKRTKEIHLGTALFFVFWKGPFSEVFVNTFGLFRVVDFSDNIALISVFVSFQLLKKEAFLFKFHPILLQFIFLLSCFSFIATTRPPGPEDYAFENEFLNLNLKNESDKKLVILIDFKYSEEEIAAYKKQEIPFEISRTKIFGEKYCSTASAPYVFKPSDSIQIVKEINEKWAFNRKAGNIDPMVLGVDSTTVVKLPVHNRDSLVGFPKNFKISILDSNWKTIKVYTKKIFFDQINKDQEAKLNEFSRPSFFNFTFGKKKKTKPKEPKEPEEPLVNSYAYCYGRWVSRGSGPLNKIQISSKFCIDDRTGAVYDCRYNGSTVFVETPNLIYVGIIKKVTTDQLVIRWENNRTLTYKRSATPSVLGD